MRVILTLTVTIFLVLDMLGQETGQWLEGSVSYITSQSVYVRFTSTDGIDTGDTLFVMEGGIYLPALSVRQLSSISCVCDPLGSQTFETGDVVWARVKSKEEPERPHDFADEAEPKKDTVVPVQVEVKGTEAVEQEELRRQEIHGRIAVSSYTNFSNTPAANSQRMRYTFSLEANNIAETKLSAETYISFHHRLDEDNGLQESIFNGLKIYNLAVKYDFDDKTRALLGRKINPRISSLGAVDGLQVERDLGNFTVGALSGSRPDYSDYGFNFELFQYGAWLSHEYRGSKGQMQTTVAFVEQNNTGNTDRRFAYLQHSNSLLRSLYFFGSAEMDLYQVENGNAESTFNLTNLYLMLRYRITRQLSVSGSYSARQNIIYYESYKDIIERLLERETLQGFRLQVHYRPLKHLSVGVTGNYRFREDDERQTRNLYGYITYSRIPLLGISATISATYLESVYNSGEVYSAGISRSLLKGRLTAGLNYRYVDYSFFSTEFPFTRNFAEANLQWSVSRKLSMSVYYEGAFEKERAYHRVYVNVTQRF